jgi:hypothetical protein
MTWFGIADVPMDVIEADILGAQLRGKDIFIFGDGHGKQAASYWITRMGFRPIAYRGPETGSPYLVSYVVLMDFSQRRPLIIRDLAQETVF